MRNKTQQCIDHSIQENAYNKKTGTMGTILTYDRYSNMATVLTTKPETDEADEVMKNVPCPTYMGIQMVAPEPGRLCWIIFKNGNITQPLISHYYNHRYDEHDYPRQAGSYLQAPSYLLG